MSVLGRGFHNPSLPFSEKMPITKRAIEKDLDYAPSSDFVNEGSPMNLLERVNVAHMVGVLVCFCDFRRRWVVWRPNHHYS
jgi:hypothetical protein